MEIICPRCRKQVRVFGSGGARVICPCCSITITLEKHDMIEFTCTQCGKQLRVKDEAAGKNGKCPQCGTVLHVPNAGQQPVLELMEVQDFAAREEYRPAKPPNRTPLILLSFLIPLAGVIVGAVFLSKEKAEDQATGKACLLWAIIGFVTGVVLFAVF